MRVRVQLWGKRQIDVFDLLIKVRLFPLDVHRLLKLNLFVKIKKVVLFLKISTFLLLSRPFGTQDI